MIRVLIIALILALLSFGATYLVDLEGAVVLTIPALNKTVTLPLFLAGVLFVVFSGLLAILWAITMYLIVLPKRLSQAANRRRHFKGYDALKKGIIAVSSGDLLAAQRNARRAQHLLTDDSLALLLKAQAAQTAGKREEASDHFQKMLLKDETRLVGLRGLYVEARRKGEQDIASRYAQDAAQLAPAITWASDAVLESQCAKGDWRSAVITLDRKVALGTLDRDTGKRQRAVLLTADARSREKTAPDEALSLSLKALKLAPNLVPAAVIAGSILAKKGRIHKASKILESTWILHPHPELARIYINIRPSDSAVDRRTRAKHLAEVSKWSIEGRHALANAHVDAREFTEARIVLEPLLKDIPTVNTCLLMASIEQSELDAKGSVRNWIARAAHAPRDPVWIADGVISEQWEPISPITGKIDAFVWKAPPDVLGAPLLLLSDPVIGDADDTQKVIPIAPPEVRTRKVEEPVSFESKDKLAKLEEPSSEKNKATEPSIETTQKPTSAADEPTEKERQVPEKVATEVAEPLVIKEKSPEVIAEVALAEKKADLTAVSDNIIEEAISGSEKVVAEEVRTEEIKKFPFDRLPDDPGPEEDPFSQEKKPRKWFNLFS